MILQRQIQHRGNEKTANILRMGLEECSKTRDLAIKENTPMPSRIFINFILVLGILTSVATLAQGDDTLGLLEDEIGHTPPRLSLTAGEVSFWRPGAQDWSQAQINTALAPGDLLHTGSNSKFEIQVGPKAFVRAGSDTQLGLENHERDLLRFRVNGGIVSFDLRSVEPGQTVEVDTPHGVLTVNQRGYYRVVVNDDRTSFISRQGKGTIVYTGGESVALRPNGEVVIEGIERPHAVSHPAPQLDEWDRWNYARTDHLLDTVSARYVSPGVYGLDELDRYGTWKIVPSYGAVWIPRGVDSRWAPYSAGAWVLDPYYGWTWVDTAPWGWAPYHYGRWVFVSGFWAWAPGPVVVRPAYAPALVAFFGRSSVGVHISVGVGPMVGWVALGWGEPCVPWWGPSGFRHRPWWGGWGGPRVVNNVIITKTTVVNVQEIHAYRNVSARNAVIAVNQDRFGRGPVTSARVSQLDAETLKPIHTEPRVIASSASFTPREQRPMSTPRRIPDRSVAATRPEVASTGLVSSGKEQNIVSTRVSTPAPAGRPYGQSEMERATTDRARTRLPAERERPQARKPVPKSSPPVIVQPSQQQSESQRVRSSPAKPQPPSPQAASGPAKPPESPKTSRPQLRERESVGAPSMSSQASQREHNARVALPPPTRPQPSVRQAETHAQAPPARALPGEPASRLSPNRGDRRGQQRMEEAQAPEPLPQRGMPQDVARKGR